MPDYIPQEFGQPNQIYNDELELRKWRRAYPRRGESKSQNLNTAFRLRR
jgi:hypothetical protein